MDVSVNPYRGCEHGCIYCYARPYHEYLGLSAGVDFESRIFVKENAAALLRKALMAKSWTPQVIGFSGVTDCYQPIERRLKLTRACLEVLVEFRNPVAVITKSHTVTRDIDLLRELAAHGAAHVMLSVTTLDDRSGGRDGAARVASGSGGSTRFARCRPAGIPVGVMVAPIIPGLTDHEVPAILKAAAEAGAATAGRTVVRLPHGVKELFADWLQAHMPDRKDKVLNRLRAMRHGKLNESTFGSRMTGEARSPNRSIRCSICTGAGSGLTKRVEILDRRVPPPPGPQPGLFD